MLLLFVCRFLLGKKTMRSVAPPRQFLKVGPRKLRTRQFSVPHFLSTNFLLLWRGVRHPLSLIFGSHMNVLAKMTTGSLQRLGSACALSTSFVILCIRWSRSRPVVQTARLVLVVLLLALRKVCDSATTVSRQIRLSTLQVLLRHHIRPSRPS